MTTIQPECESRTIFSALTQSQIKGILHYATDTGTFTWLKTSGHVVAGVVAGSTNSQGYRGIQLNGRRFQAHRLAWLYMTGEWPLAEIDHADGKRDNNAWDNLREANRSQNTANTAAHKDNVLGLKGIRRAGNKCEASISANGKRHYLGLFDTPEEAHEAYKSAALLLHGEFARFE